MKGIQKFAAAGILTLLTGFGFLVSLTGCGGSSRTPTPPPDSPGPVQSAQSFRQINSSSDSASASPTASAIPAPISLTVTPPPTAPTPPARAPVSLSDPLIRMATAPPDAAVSVLPPPQRPLLPSSGSALSTSRTHRLLSGVRKPLNAVNSPDLNDPPYEHIAMGVLWSGSNLQGVEVDIPFPQQNGYQYTPSGDIIYISDSPEVDPTLCVEFGIELSNTASSFYVFNQCQGGNESYFTFLSGPIANHAISQSMSNSYLNSSTGEATALEQVMSDGLHVYLWNYPNGTWDDTLGYGVTGNNTSSGGLWPATEYYLETGSCPSNQQWSEFVSQMNSGSGMTAAWSSGGVALSSGSDDCLEWGPTDFPGGSWTAPVWVESPIYSETGFSLVTPSCTPDSYGYCSVLNSQTGNGECYEYHVVGGQLEKIWVDPPTTFVYTTYEWSGEAGVATETKTYAQDGCAVTSTHWSPSEPKVAYSDPNLP